MIREFPFVLGIGAASLLSAGLLSTSLPAVAQSIKLEPEKMSKIGTVDERYQSYNVEMLEVTGGRFWAPYKGGVALLAINADRSKAQNLTLPKASSRYSLTAKDLMDSTVMLNGAELKLTSDGDLPGIAGASERAGQVSLDAASITFFAIPEAGNSACR